MMAEVFPVDLKQSLLYTPLFQRSRAAAAA